jgi:hypothetical protein
MFHGQTSILGANELWKTRASSKCCFFVWLVIHGRCWTSECLHWHTLPNGGPCALCAQCTESLDHLLAECVYSREVCFKTLNRCGWQYIATSANDSFMVLWLCSHKLVVKGRCKAFNSLILLVAWNLWCQRNDSHSF